MSVFTQHQDISLLNSGSLSVLLKVPRGLNTALFCKPGGTTAWLQRTSYTRSHNLSHEQLVMERGNVSVMQK